MTSPEQKKKNASYQRRRYWRNKRAQRSIPNFPYLLPYWRGWTPMLFRQMLRFTGYSFDRFQHIIYKKTFFRWEAGEFELNPDLLQAITTEAEKHGWWHYHAFPPKVVLVLAREPKEMIAFCHYFRPQPEEVRWIRTPRQLKDYTYTQVKWIAISNTKRLRGLHLHPAIKRFGRRCARFQKRETVFWKPTLGAKRSIPKE